MLGKVIRSAIVAVALGLVVGVGAASAHVHSVTTGNGEEQELANGQNHPGFVVDAAAGQVVSCEGVNEPANAGPAGFGLETAHHGPDAGEPGKGDGCYQIEGGLSPLNPASDRNPGIR